MSKTIIIKDRKAFVEFLESYSKICEAFVLNVSSGLATAIAASQDNTMFLYGEIRCGGDYEGKINIPDSRRLMSIIKGLSSNSIKLVVDSNSLNYVDASFKFKYHTLEDGWITQPSLNISKIKSFEYSSEWEIPKSGIGNILKKSLLVNNVNKCYIGARNGKVICQITDKSRDNVDDVSFVLADSESDSDDGIVNLDNLRLLNVKCDVVTLKVNTDIGIFGVYCDVDDYTLNYIITTLIE